MSPQKVSSGLNTYRRQRYLQYPRSTIKHLFTAILKACAVNASQNLFLKSSLSVPIPQSQMALSLNGMQFTFWASLLMCFLFGLTQYVSRFYQAFEYSCSVTNIKLKARNVTREMFTIFRLRFCSQCVQSICDCKLNPQNYFGCIFHFWYSNLTIAKQRLHDRMKETLQQAMYDTQKNFMRQQMSCTE